MLSFDSTADVSLYSLPRRSSKASRSSVCSVMTTLRFKALLSSLSSAFFFCKG